MSAPTYYAKVLSIAGATIAAPLEIATVEFTDTVFVPGQQRPGEFTLTLRDTRDPLNEYLRATYNTLAREQRIEIYENANLLGDPVFTGVLIRQTKTLAGARQWHGYRSEYRLAERKLRAYHSLTGDINDAIAELVKTYNIVFSDDFNRTTGIGANWTVSAGACSIVNNVAEIGTDDLAAALAIANATQWTASEFDDVKIGFDFSIGEDSYLSFVWAWDAGSSGTAIGQLNVSRNTTDPATSDAEFDLYYDDTGAVALASRVIPFLDNTMGHLDIYNRVESGGRRIVVVFNGLEIFDYLDTVHTGAQRAGRVSFSWTPGAAPDGHLKIDNFFFAPATGSLVVGTAEASAETIDQNFNGDTQLDALEWLMEKYGWEYRIRPQAGAGNDLIDYGTTVGDSFASVLTLEDGENIIDLNVDDANEGFATSLNVYGQSRDDTTSGFIAVNVSAMVTYGIVEDDYSDDRIADSATAKTIGDVRLTRLAAGNVSMSGRVVDESELFRQSPVVGYAIIGDAVIGGRKQLRAGDIVAVKSADLNINNTSAEIVALTRRSGDPGIDLVFDYHGYRRSDETRTLNRRIAQLTRALAQRIDTQSIVFALSGTTAQTLSFNMRGSLYRNVYLDVTSATWGGNTVTFAIDGSDRTTVLFGAATIGANASASDATYLIYSGAHTITLTPSASVTVTVGIRPVLQG
jgi:hypothetical protein